MAYSSVYALNFYSRIAILYFYLFQCLKPRVWILMLHHPLQITANLLPRDALDLTAIALEIIAEVQLRRPEFQASATVAPHMFAHGNERLVRLLLTELIDNAVKFAGNLGTSIRIACTKNEGGQVFVLDDGAGFDPELSDAIFEPHYRLDQLAEGRGLGLTAARKAVEAHEGKIWAQAKPGHGAAFYFTLGEHRIDCSSPDEPD